MPIDFRESKRIRPMPSDPAEFHRIEEQSRRRRILEGGWRRDATEWLLAMLGPTRASLVNGVNLSHNFLRTYSNAVTTLYDVRPEVLHPLGEFPEFTGTDLDIPGRARPVRFKGALDKAGLWSIMPRLQLFTVGINEMILSVSVVQTKKGPALRYREVYPDMVVADPDPNNPGQPIRVRELRERPDPRTGDGKLIWAWDEYDIRDEDNPIFRVVAATPAGAPGEDITNQVFGRSLSGDGYEWRFGDDEPFIPWVFYHRFWPTRLWSPWEGIEAVDGTLNLSVHWSAYDHAVLDGGFAIKYVGGGEVDGTDADTTAEGGRTRAVADPIGVIHLRQHPEATNLIVGEWGPAVNPLEMGQANSAAEARLAENMTGKGADVLRTSGDPRSGYALAVGRANQQEERSRHLPIIQPSDEEMVGKSAALWNRAHGEMLVPEDNWIVEYGLSAAPAAPPAEDQPAAPQDGQEDDESIEPKPLGGQIQ